MTSFQIVVDCASPDPLSRFWAAALGYVLEPAPDGYDAWDAYWRAVGVPEDELGQGEDCIVDPTGAGPRIWFQQVPEPKSVKNRLHLDLRASGGRADPLIVRRAAVDARADELVALGATRLRDMSVSRSAALANTPLEVDGLAAASACKVLWKEPHWLRFSTG